MLSLPTKTANPKTAKPKTGFTLIELMIVVAIIGLLASIALPNFIRFQALSKQGEAKTNLRSLYFAQRTYYAEKESYTSELGATGYQPERGNRYAFGTSVSLPDSEARVTATLPTPTTPVHSYQVDLSMFLGATPLPAINSTSTTLTLAPEPGGTVPPSTACSSTMTGATAVIPGRTGGFCAFATGNIDNDTNIDTWYVSNWYISGPAGPCNLALNMPSGQPVNVYNDTSCP